MQNNIEFLVDATRSASRFLHRDYFELEHLQSSEKNTKNFVSKAKQRVIEILEKSLGRYYKTLIFDNKIVNSQNLKFNGDNAALISILDGEKNFERALPFFATIVTILSKKRDEVFAERVVVNFPILGNIYYAQHGKGAWAENHSANFAGSGIRLRVSKKNKLEDSLVCCNNLEMALAAKISSSNIRVFESCAYQMILLASGKADVALFKNDLIFSQGFELLIRESGGVSYVDNDIFVASNYYLERKTKELNVSSYAGKA